jgi:pseudouridine synthase
VGRLDYDAEGLILLTNDGELAHRVAHPSFGVRKIYLVKVKGRVAPDALGELARGPVLDGRRRRGMQARILHHHNDKTWLEVTLKEGIQHHLKKAFAAVGHRVLKIKRYQVGPVALGELRPGEARRLSREEVAWMLEPPPRHGRGHPPADAPRAAP